MRLPLFAALLQTDPELYFKTVITALQGSVKTFLTVIERRDHYDHYRKAQRVRR